MNLDRKLYGRLTIGKTQISLGFADPVELCRRLLEQYRTHKSSSSNISVIIEWSSEQLAASLLSDDQRVIHEFNQLMTLSSPDDPTDWPGITIGRVAEVSVTPEYQAYNLIATHPDRRIGLTHEEIEAIKRAYFEAYPDCAPHFPKWIDI